MHAAPQTTETAHHLRLELTDVALEYGARRVLSHVTLALEQGDILVIAGPNGSGKSSLLRLMCGLQRPTSGFVQLHWRGNTYRTGAMARFIGWVAPDLHLYRDLTAIENLRFFADVRGLQRTTADLEALLGMVGLGGRGADLLATYSSGMAQRLRYAYALLHQPPVLLLDEPTVTLDERGAALVEHVIARQRERGITIIATNDPREIRFGDYVLRLEGGDM
ncbi:MAG TPA: ABC transporter ATP-binding protein [Roseiflexaceae bacterium]|jgi:heme exporter protein A|nr:ABC transporter ATP-binding protein [Roseiflexaceae bacterium]